MSNFSDTVQRSDQVSPAVVDSNPIELDSAHEEHSAQEEATHVPPASRRPVAAVTGCTSGLGRAFAVELATRGNDMVLVGRNAAAVAELADELRRNHGAVVEELVADLEQSNDRARVVARLEQGVTALVNNAGYATPGDFWTLDPEAIEAELAVNVTAVLQFTRAALPSMLAAADGMIINVASISGLITGATGAYGAEKAWVIKFSEGLAGQVGPSGVRVQALCPGFMDTPFHQRVGNKPEDFPKPLVISVDDVVKGSLADIEKGWAVSVPGWRIKFVAMLNRFSPRRWVWKFDSP
ncbi:SDR family NAD(P)-dependent oxidoreductase [Skermania piniformis]|uniref:SDR family NAD(P)-dependent oxidoreductase n=1 Tax=Skermania pinensis TaxID=39122 RepID=A0ABX8SA53_9ACTN|nr:SDR family NAD(P)-dependent oxidoreductase [Skermania piniformis]QXQ14653.1 SDR family NAD(P)-dependent oxidoreductase [Skermania piniformis]